jgi:ABC-2 type transport system ATP-binding protein
MLELKNVSKNYGQFQALIDETFTVKPGEVCGLIGQNGAGKTTTFRLILDFIKLNQGAITWNGKPLNQLSHDFIGYLPEERGLYPKMTVEQQILFFAQLHGMSRQKVLAEIDQWLELFQVKGSRKDKVKNLSKGNQQKVQLIATLIFHPKLAILDEPFSGLDPVNASLLKNGIRMLQEEGSAIIFSSHDMSNVEELSSNIVMLKNGRTVLNGTVSDIRNSYEDTRIFIRKSGITAEELRELSGVEAVTENAGRFKVDIVNSEVGSDILKAITADGVVKEFNQQAPTLDEIFRMKAGDQDE